MKDNITTTSNTVEDAPSPGLGRWLGTRLLGGAGTIGVVRLTSDNLALGLERVGHGRRERG